MAIIRVLFCFWSAWNLQPNYPPIIRIIEFMNEVLSIRVIAASERSALFCPAWNLQLYYPPFIRIIEFMNGVLYC